MRRLLATCTLLVAVAAAVAAWPHHSRRVAPRPPLVVGAFAALDAQGRCESAATLLTTSERWPMTCRWRAPSDALQGQAFPPPKGDPPFDDPHIELYVDPAQSREQLAHAIAHELGHMHLTREPAFVPEWLAARDLPPDTPSPVWTEDYAEVFAALFSPPSDRWRAPTPRPSPDALADLRARFFS